MVIPLRRVLWSGVVLGLLFYLALTLWLAFRGIFFPYQLDYGEGIVLWFTRELALGHSIYKGLEGLPYASSNYPPLAMLLAIPFRALFGDSYVGGRWLNFAVTLVIAAFVYRLVQSSAPLSKKGVCLNPSLLAALFFLGSTFIYHWIPLFRVDLIGLAFTVSGIFFVWRWERANVKVALTWNLALAMLFFLAALYTKHSLIFAPAAAIVAIFLKNRHAAIFFALALALSGGGIFLALNTMTRGGFAFGLINSNATSWLWNTFWPILHNFVWTYFVLIALAAWAGRQRVRTGKIGVLEIYALTAMASLALAGRVGAWENYCFEAIFVVCAFAGIALTRLSERGRMWLPLLLLIQLGLFWREHDPAIAQKLLDETRAGNEQISSRVRSTHGTIISEDMGLLVTNGQPVTYYTFQYSSLARAGAWNQHWELENLRAGNFPLVILNQGTRAEVDHYRNFTHEFVSALDYGYARNLENAHYQIYTPAPLAHLRNDKFDDQLQMVGWSLAPDENLRAGQTFMLTTVWCAMQKLNARYTAFAHLEDANGSVVSQDDHEPRVGFIPNIQWYPTTQWAANEMVRDTFTLKLPTNIIQDTLALRVGWYDSETQNRLPVKGGNDFIELEKLKIAP